MIWNLMIIIGILFVINGFVSMGHSRAVEKVRGQMPDRAEIYYGGAKGLLFFSSTDVLLAVKNNGSILKAFSIKSGWLRRSRAEELALKGCQIQSLAKEIPALQPAQQKACIMASRQYERRKRR